MNKLWLSAIATACLLAGNAAQAGGHGHHDDWDRGHAEYRHCDDDDRGRHWGWHHRPVFVAPVVYSRPVYYARPVYYERPDYYVRRVYEERPAYYGSAYDSDGEIHGTISVGF